MVQWRPRRLSAAQLEERRLAAAREFPRCRVHGISQSEIARAVGVGRQSVSRWYAAWQTLGVSYHFRSLGRVLRAHGWSPQRPATRATERNEALIEAWLKRDWPRIKKGLVEAGGSLPS